MATLPSSPMGPGAAARPGYALRRAEVTDRACLEALVRLSARALSCAHYSGAQVEAALQGLLGVDGQLIEDGTYWVATIGEAVIGCGGWSRRRTLFGGDRGEHGAVRDPGLLDPARDAARIRAFFIDPQYARLGVASALLARCESEARKAGFSRLELMATLPGVPLYSQRGFVAGSGIEYPLPGGLALALVPMEKRLSASDDPAHG